jgi:quercetin dioxygenase-like cupin family protein
MTLPSPINEQERLLTIDTTKEKIVDIGTTLPGVKVVPLFLDPENGVWVLFATFAPGTRVPTHFHTGTVHFYTTKGAWNYLEYPNDVQTAGCYLYEPGGSIHTFTVADNAPQAAEGFMVVHGANVNFDAEGNFINIMDAGWIEKLIVETAKAQDLKPLRYIRPGRAAFTRG